MITNLLIYSVADFAIYVIGALVFFSAGLLYMDSWRLNRKKRTPLVRSMGFFLLALVYLSYASFVNLEAVTFSVQIVKVISVLVIALSFIKEPVLRKPRTQMSVFALPVVFSVATSALVPLSAALFLTVALWSYLRSTKGLDKQLKPLTYSFLFLALSEFVKISFGWSDTLNVFWSNALSVHSPLWNLHMLLQFVGVLILGIWVWGYIRFRLQIQVFTTILTATLIIFLVTTSFFSFLLLKNLEKDALAHLRTDANVFQYSLDRLQLEALSHARAVAIDSSLEKFLAEDNKQKLFDLSSNSLIDQNLASLVITSSSGEVVARAEDKDNIGQNVSNDKLVKSALTGQQLSTLVLDNNPILPGVFVKSAVPIKNNLDEVVGTVETGFAIDNAFVDGVKDVTGLDATVFAGTKKAASTIIAPDGKSRLIGLEETDQKITDLVLGTGESYIGPTEVLNEPYYATYTPLVSYGGNVVGMLFVGKPQTELLEIVQQSIRSTFLGSIIMMLVSVIPVYFISRFIRRNIEA